MKKTPGLRESREDRARTLAGKTPCSKVRSEGRTLAAQERSAKKKRVFAAKAAKRGKTGHGSTRMTEDVFAPTDIGAKSLARKEWAQAVSTGWASVSCLLSALIRVNPWLLWPSVIL